MPGNRWSVEEEKFFWEVIAPQAPAGADDLSKRAKKEVKTAWGPLATQIKEEMSVRLEEGETLRRNYTDLGCYEHYFQNFKKSNYSPHAKAFVAKYRAGLEVKATSTRGRPQRRAVTPAPGTQMSAEPAPGASQSNKGKGPQSSGGNMQPFPQKIKLSLNMPHNDRSLVPEAPMHLGSAPRPSTSALASLANEALRYQGDSAASKDSNYESGSTGMPCNDKELEHACGRANRSSKTTDTGDTSPRSGPSTENSAQVEEQIMQRNFRRAHKAARRQILATLEAQSSASPAAASFSPPSSPPTGGSAARSQVSYTGQRRAPPGNFNNYRSGYYNGPMLHHQYNDYYGSPYDTQLGPAVPHCPTLSHGAQVSSKSGPEQDEADEKERTQLRR